MTKRKIIQYQQLSEEEEIIAKAIVNSAFKVHRELGPGLLEKVYEACLAYELNKSGFSVRRQVNLPVVYDRISFDEGLRIDLLVEDLVICEIKAVDLINPVWKA